MLRADSLSKTGRWVLLKFCFSHQQLKQESRPVFTSRMKYAG